MNARDNNDISNVAVTLYCQSEEEHACPLPITPAQRLVKMIPTTDPTKEVVGLQIGEPETARPYWAMDVNEEYFVRIAFCPSCGVRLVP